MMGPWFEVASRLGPGPLSASMHAASRARFADFLLALLVCLTIQGSHAASSPAHPPFLATGAETRIIAPDGTVAWQYPHASRDGWVLPDGEILLALSKSDRHPGGAVVRVSRSGEEKFRFEGTQSEVNTVQPLAGGQLLLTEAGPRPRLLEIDGTGKILVQVPIQCQLTNHHMQSRMTRKLGNGNYLVPQLLDRVVREYQPDGKIAWEVSTPHWPFTAIRLPNGNTLIDCTQGHLVIEVNQAGKTVWSLSNDDFSEPLIRDACGGQRLPNGNTVIASYGIGANRTKLLEVTRARTVAWTYTDATAHGIHTVQILGPDLLPLPGPQWR